MDYPGYSVSKDLAQLEQALRGVTPVRPAAHNLSRLFALVFRERFLALPIAGEEDAGIVVATRSNWSYHTAISVYTAADMLNLDCRFESMGRFDAVIETRFRPRQIVLLAEWEWHCDDIFGKGKELPKLVRGLRARKQGDAFLFTYCTVQHYVDFVERVIRFWQCKATMRWRPSLYLPVLTYEKERRQLVFQALRTVEVQRQEVAVWDDIRIAAGPVG